MKSKNSNKTKMKKEYEVKVSKFFLKRFSLRYDLDLDYKVEPYWDENSDVDVLAIPNKKHLPEFKFQVVKCEGEILKTFAELRKKAEETKQIIVGTNTWTDMNIEEWIEEAIKKKTNKYSPDSKKEIILLITGEFGPLFNKEYAKKKFARFRNYDFKGIYFVHLPKMPAESSHSHNGQIIAIKDIYCNHGEYF